ncbi:MAG: mechanosensitive ion channel family protein [Burkholderiales bacterium]|nr:mechanosensitive ion channel family protein [Burkholderiales bacterium]
MIIIVVALLLSRMLRRLIVRLHESEHLAPIMARRLQTFRRWTILVVTILILMQAFGVFGNAWALISTGLAAMALGFVAAWSMLSNATAALLLLTFRPFRLGDTVELVEPAGTGVGGRVVDINLMYTILSVPPAEKEPTEAPQLLHIPNNLFFQKIVRTRSTHTRGSKASFFTPPER